MIRGFYKGKKGVIKSIYHNSIFLYNKDFISSNGIFVDKCDNVEIMGSELLQEDDKIAASKVNMKLIPEHLRKLIGTPIRIISGNWKGYIGNLKSANDKIARVELTSKNKTVPVSIDFIEDINKDLTSNDLIPSTPRANVGLATRTPAYYPQSPNILGGTSPKWNPSTRIFYLFS